MRRRLWSLTGRLLYWVLLPAIWIYAASTKPRARVLLVSGDQALVVKNWLGAGCWALPGGGIEPGEGPLDAAVRELHEELGIVISPEALLPLGQHVAIERGGLHSRYYLFAAELTEKPQLQIREREIVDVRWLPTDELMQRPKGVGNTVKQSVSAWINR